MNTWPNRRILDLFGIELPIVLAPMAGAGLSELALAVARAGGLGSIPCALLGPAQAQAEVARYREHTRAPLNLNFFCHQEPAADPARDAHWKSLLLPYYAELGVDPDAPGAPPLRRAPFDNTLCELVESTRPEVVSFHFGLPAAALLDRVKASGARVMSSATTVAEARWLEAQGCDVIIAQGTEAGGHRGHFLSEDFRNQAGTLALVPQIVDAVKLPVIATGGIGDGRGIAAAFALGAAAVQLGTAYLFCPEATVAPLHRAVLRAARDDGTELTNLFTGRPARGIVNRLMRELGPISTQTAAFPYAGAPLAALRARAEPQGSGDFQSLWSGQSAALGRELPAGELTTRLAADALRRLAQLGSAAA